MLQVCKCHISDPVCGLCVPGLHGTAVHPHPFLALNLVCASTDNVFLASNMELCKPGLALSMGISKKVVTAALPKSVKARKESAKKLSNGHMKLTGSSVRKSTLPFVPQGFLAVPLKGKQLECLLCYTCIH